MANVPSYIDLICLFEHLLTKTDVIKEENQNNVKINSPTCNDTIMKVLLRFNPESPIILIKNKTTKKMILIAWNYLFTELKKAGNTEDIPHDHLNRLYTSGTNFINNLYSNIHSRNNIFTKMRKIIRDHFGDAHVLYKRSINELGLTYEERIKLRMDYQIKVNEIGSIRDQLVPIYQNDIQKKIDMILGDSINLGVIRSIIVVQLCIGSRLIEALKVSNYYLLGDSPVPIIEVIGLAKTHSNNRVIRPLLFISSNDFFSCVDRIRSYPDIKSCSVENAYELSRKYDSLVNAECAKLFNEYTSDTFVITSHRLRYICANMAYILYGRRSFEADFIASFLGHASDSSAKSYMGINCIGGANPVSSTNEVIPAEIADERSEDHNKDLYFPDLDIKKIPMSRDIYQQRIIKDQALKDLISRLQNKRLVISYRIANNHGFCNHFIEKFRVRNPDAWNGLTKIKVPL